MSDPGLSSQSRRLRLALLFVLALPLFVHLGPILFTTRMFAFRDVAHYYYPLFELIQHQWRSGHVPLWNALENGGQPLLADSTSSVFYPGQLLFLTPLPFPVAFKLYVIGHFVLAIVSMYLAVRGWGHSPQACCIAALSYVFGGYVLFQYCNVVYLVGAAWLPLALYTGQRSISARSWQWGVKFAVCLALMIVGGDPQSVYHTALVCGLFLFMAWGSARLTNESSFFARAAVFGGSLSLAAALAAVQIGPSIEWTRCSTRVVHDGPRSVWHVITGQWLGESLGPAIQHLWAPAAPDTHDGQVYQFSVAPWRVAELIWPNASGKVFPVHQRWTQHAWGEQEVWNPSLYSGWIPLLLAFSAFGLRKGPVHQRWWSLILVLGIMASFGGYGLVWLINLVRAATGLAPIASVGAPVGGLYHFFVVWMPGYTTFRYPSKWLVIATCAMSFLAAAGWDRCAAEQFRRLRRPLLLSLLLSGLLLIGLSLAKARWSDWLAGARADAVFGPLDSAGAYRDLWCSLAQNCVVSLLGMMVVSRLFPQKGPAAQTYTLLLLTSIDLIAAHYGEVVSVSAETFTRSSEIGEKLTHFQAQEEALAETLIRVWRDPEQSPRPKAWAARSSPSRFDELVRWDRETLFPKYHLECGPGAVMAVDTRGAIHSADHAAFFRFLHEADRAWPATAERERIELLRMVGTHFIIDTSGQLTPNDRLERVPLDSAGAEACQLFRVIKPQPRVWIVHDATYMSLPTRRRLNHFDEHTARVLLVDRQLRDFTRSAVIETNSPRLKEQISAALADRAPVDETSAESETCQLIYESPSEIKLQLQLLAPAVIVLSDMYCPGWTAETRRSQDTKTAPVFRVNRIMRGVLVDRAGQTIVTLRYRPPVFTVGAVISVIATLVVVASVVGRPFLAVQERVSAWRNR